MFARRMRTARQRAERAFVEFERPTVNRGKLDDDRKAKPGAGPRLVKPFSPFDRSSASILVEARPIVVNLGDENWIRIPFGTHGANRDSLARPLSRIVEQVSDHRGGVDGQRKPTESWPPLTAAKIRLARGSNSLANLLPSQLGSAPNDLL